jgi:hypothetical protein
MTIRAAVIDGQWAFEDSDNPGIALGFLNAAGDGGGVLYHVSEFIVTNGTVLETITDAGSGAVITDAERTSLHGHPYQSFLDSLAPPTSGQVGYIPIATGVGTWGWTTTPAIDPNFKGYHADLTALQTAYPTGVDGEYAILINSPGPHAVAVWDISAGPAAWVEEATGAVTSVNPGSGVQTGAVVFDADDITEGATNLWLIASERADIALVAGHTTSIAANTVLATHANISVLNSLSDAGSGVVMSVAERAAMDKIRTPGAGKTGYLLQATGETLDDFDWIEVPAGGVGTVTSVNGVSPVAGNVTLDMDDMTETASSKILTQTERTSISNTETQAATNATAIARLKTQQSLSVVALSIPFDIAGGLNGVVTLVGGTAVTLPLLTSTLAGGIASSVGETALLIVYQDGTGGATLDTSAFEQPGGVATVLSTAPLAKDVLSIYIESATKMILTNLKNVAAV